MIKKAVIFSIVYFLLNIVLALVLFSWNSFGGSNSTNLIQKAITFFFSFPGDLNILKTESVFLFLLINTFFWSIIFYLCILFFDKLKKKISN